MEKNFSSLELLKFAISVEEEGVKFYTVHAEKAVGANKELLEKLANEEKQHAAVFQQIYDEFADNSHDFDYLSDMDVEAIFNAYAKNEVFSRRSVDVENFEEVLKIAAQTEQVTVDYYSELLIHAKEPLIGILERLIAEEKEHYRTLIALISE